MQDAIYNYMCIARVMHASEVIEDQATDPLTRGTSEGGGCAGNVLYRG